MRSFNNFAVMLILMLVAALGYAQQQRGDVELQFQALYFTTIGTDFTIGQGTISAKIGPYLTDNLQIGIGPTLSITTTTDYTVGPAPTYTLNKETKTTTTFGSTAFFVYSFLGNAKVVPYIGAQYFKQDFSNSNDNGSVGISAGLKYFFAKKTALDISNYLFTLNTGQQGGMLMFAVGLSFLL